MGLDNYFQLRDKGSDGKITIAHFRKFYELTSHFYINDTNQKVIEPSELYNLRRVLKPVVEVLAQFSDEQICYYDEVGYPNSFLSDEGNNPLRTKSYFEFVNGEFGVYASQSSYIGSKILKLFSVVETLIEILDNDYEENYEVVLITSF